MRPPDHIHSPVSPPLPRGSELAALYEQLLEFPNVLGCYIGEKTRSGVLTGQISVVTCVAEKVPRRWLTPPEHIPPVIYWRPTPQARIPIPTDVQWMGKSGTEQGPPVAGPGDLVRGLGPCTVGVAMNHPDYGSVITTAGHGFTRTPGKIVTYPPQSRPKVAVLSAGPDGMQVQYGGQLLKTSITSYGDYALIYPDPTLPVRNFYGDVYPISGISQPTPDELPARCFALTATGQRSTWLRGIHAWVGIDGWPMRDLLITDYVTEGGDSGCCLVDASFRAMGLLVGFVYIDGIVRSAFASVAHPLSQERAHLY